MLFRILSVGLMTLVLAGCGYNSANAEPTVPGKGKLTHANGQPVKFASIMLVPLPGKGGIQCGGLTNPDGTFTLKTGEKEGVVPGGYMVVVKPFINNKTPEEMIEEIQNSIPAKFQDDENSPLSVTVKTEADLQIQLK